MTGVFGQTYAGAYDALYRSKDYEGETDLVERVLVREDKSGPRAILDLGCGTGNHALPLARRGHVIVGVERSAAMLAQARAKAMGAELPGATTPPVFLEGDVRTADAGRRFDAALMMFAVLGYMHDDEDVLAALANVRRHLDPGGVFVFDVWNGVAVMADQPKGRRVTVAEGSASIERETRTKLDLGRHLCHVSFELARTQADGRRDTAVEEHVMRYFFEPELYNLLGQSGLDLVSLRSFPDEASPPNEKVWNVVGVARAV